MVDQDDGGQVLDDSQRDGHPLRVDQALNGVKHSPQFHKSHQSQQACYTGDTDELRRAGDACTVSAISQDVPRLHDPVQRNNGHIEEKPSLQVAKQNCTPPHYQAADSVVPCAAG
eukprot:CAMPEP_0115194838 /NCGR_PEP_ID=MMETSP0270-20121206/14275_1 /TAXON_ID=71861 /ORGANISM="Scrippsiella trochoidea, Strain CCMP3099" /LENGTH=114 /DNA_ID=CAMNT_0002608149 /DNA_START=412 /DNA_END=756 /DNA_ORIENTATION=+